MNLLRTCWTRSDPGAAGWPLPRRRPCPRRRTPAQIFIKAYIADQPFSRSKLQALHFPVVLFTSRRYDIILKLEFDIKKLYRLNRSDEQLWAGCLNMFSISPEA